MESNIKRRNLEHLKERLLDSAQEGDLSSLQAFVEKSQLEKGEREELVNAVDFTQWTTLHFASSKGHPTIVKWILSDSGGRAAGFNKILAKTSTGATAFHVACQYGYVECAQALVEGSKIENGEREALIKAVNNGLTALHCAACADHPKIVKWLLSDSGGRAAGFNGLLTRTQEGHTVLHIACQYGHLDCVQALVEGSKVDNGEREELINAVNKHEWNALHFAIFGGYPAIIEWLLSDTGGRAAGFKGAAAKTGTGATALYFACRRGELECVQALVEGCKIDNGEREELMNAVEKLGWTALHQAVHNGTPSIVEWLLSETGGRAAGLKSSTITAKTAQSQSALHLALQHQSVEIIQALLSGCTSAERMNLFLIIDDHGWTALHHAVRRYQPEIIRDILLLHPETQLIIDHRDHRGMTALHRAVIGSIDEESCKEWRTFDGNPRREEIVAALLMTTPSSQAGAQIDPNVGLKFD